MAEKGNLNRAKIIDELIKLYNYHDWNACVYVFTSDLLCIEKEL